MLCLRYTMLGANASRARKGFRPPVMAVLANVAIPAQRLLSIRNLKLAMSDCSLYL